MFRNSCNLRGLPVHKVDQTPRRSIVFIALILALAVGGAGQSAPAQASPAATEYRYSMIARKLKGNATICVGDDVPIHVRVIRAEFVGDVGSNVQEVPGVFVRASMSPEGVGKLNPISMMTGWDANDPGGADYKFHAEKAGTTIISFKGTINHIWWPAQLGLPPLIDRRDFVEDLVELTVEECQYKVTTISKWESSGLVKIRIEAWIHEAGLAEDGPGHYTGTGSVTWTLATDQLGDCNAQSLTTTSQAELTGARDEELTVNVAFDTANISIPVYCVGSDGGVAQGSTPVQLTPDAVTFTVPASGGGTRETHVLRGPETVSGFVVAIVTRVNQ